MILDAHVHLPSSNHAKEKEEAFLSYFPDRASAVAYLRRTGIGGVVFTTWEGVWSDTEEELENANAEALEIYESDRGFFYPGASIHPAYPKTSEKWLSLFREAGGPFHEMAGKTGDGSQVRRGRLRLGNENKSMLRQFLFCISLDLHYL